MSDLLLTGSQVFMLAMAGISFCAACVGVTYKFILRSRCTEISLCGASCKRDVLPPAQVTMDTSSLAPVRDTSSLAPVRDSLASVTSAS